MCTLILWRDPAGDGALWVGANRDEDRARRAAPPGLFVGERLRMLSPRDRQAGGTWLAVSERGQVAGLTNLADVPPRDGARSRGHLPHLALDAGNLEAAVSAVRGAVAAAPHNGFQLVIADAERSVLVVHDGASLEVLWPDPAAALVISNRHRLGALTLPAIAPAFASDLERDVRLAMLADALLDAGEHNPQGHAVLKTGGAYGTVSSSIVIVPCGALGGLVWKYAPGPPDVTEYRNYGNLARRLVAP